MKIYKQEIADGIDSLLSTQACVTYASIAEPCENISNFKFDKIKSIAALDDSDLYYVQSILVSSSWNKNDDIFDKAEVWKAKSTPEDKPTNLEHDEGSIIGHITSNYPITEDGELIPEDTPLEELPDKYHILTGSVIYRAFSNPELKERSEQLISEIESGQKYVSMECFFNDFDYGLKNQSTGEFQVLKRKDDTAYLTKHLRSYGGTGQHEGYTIGRVLRNITFSGKGFVDKPANTDSIIFSKTMLENFLQKKTDFEKKGVIENKPFSKSEKKTMNLEDTVEQINNKLSKVLTSEAFEGTFAKASDLENKISELEISVSEKQQAFEQKSEELVALEAAMKDKEEMMKKMEQEKASLQEQLDASNETLAGYKQKEEEMARKEKALKRRASLVSAGLDDESAEAAVSQFEQLDDESFEAMTSFLSSVATKNGDKKEEEMDAEKEKASEVEETEETEEAEAEESVAESSDLDNVEVEPEVNLAVSEETEVSAVESTRAALVDFVKSRLQTK